MRADRNERSAGTYMVAAIVCAFSMASRPHGSGDARSAQTAAPGGASSEDSSASRTHPYRMQRPESRASEPADTAPAAEPPPAAPPAAAQPPAAASPSAAGRAGAPAIMPADPEISAASATMVAPAPSRRMVRPPPGGGGAGAGMARPPPRPPMTFRGPQIQMHVTTVAAEGGIDVATASRVVRGAEPVFGMCYQRGLMANPSLQGMMLIRLAVDPNGRVGAAQPVATYFPDASVVECVMTRLRAIVFPPPSSHATAFVTYRIQFRLET